MNYDNLLLSTLSQDAYYLVNKELVRKLGVIPSLTLSLLIDKYKYFKKENKLDSQGGFFLSAKKTKKQINIIEQELGIARSARRTAFEILKKENLIKIIKKGNPAQYHYYINFKSVLNVLSSGDDLTPLSEVETNLSSGDDLTPLYNNNKEQKQTIKTNTPTLSEQLKELAAKNGLTYTINLREQNLFQNKLMEMNLTNDKILEQANRFFEIVKRDPKLNWIHGFSFGFKFLQFNWDKIDAWHNQNKPQVIEFKKPTPKELPKFSESDLDKMAIFL